MMLLRILICLIIGSFCWIPIVSAAEIGVIAAGRLNVRKGPERNAPIVMVLKRGNEVDVVSRDNGWLKIIHDGTVGYIRNRSRYVKTLERPEPVTATPSNLEKLRRESRNIDQKIEKHQSEIQAFSEKEVGIINGLNELDLALDKATRRAADLRTELAELEEKISKNDMAVRELIETIRKTEVYIRKRMVAMYKLNQVGQIHMLASVNSMFDFITRKNAVQTILEYDEKILKQHLKNRETLLEISKLLNQQRQEKIPLEEKLRQHIQILKSKREKRAELLSEIRNKKSLELAALDSLQQAASALDQTIMSLHVEPQKQTNTSEQAFDAFKGLLEMPVNGKVISLFGAYKNKKFNVTNFRSGIEIQADRGEPIHAVKAGNVLFSGWFKSYGNMIILDHGNHYYTIYAHAEELFKSKGERVETGEVIATVGDSASMTGTNLYFEVRHHGKPMDPLAWLKKG